MKKGIWISLFVCIFFFVFCNAVYGEESAEKKYLITDNGSGLDLFEYKAGEPVFIFGGKASTVFSKISNAKTVILEDITVSEDIDLPLGKYDLTGMMRVTSGAKISIPVGAQVSFSELNVFLADGAQIRVKGGAVEINNSEISSPEGSAVKLDYSATSTVILKSGSILSSSHLPSVEVVSGNLLISGGKIENLSGTAVFNKGYFYLSNSPQIKGIGYDIETEKGIYLSSNGVYYNSQSSMSVCFKDEFEKGSLTEIFYSAKADCAKNISVFSESGKKHELKFFENSIHTDEKSFFGVYLPFFVKFFDGGRLVEEQSKLYGESPDEITCENKLGYSFLRWCVDEELTMAFSFEEKLTGDIKLYAKYSLNAPSFNILSTEFIYDGKEREILFGELYHPLYEKGGFYTYAWYKNGEKISNAASPKIRDVKDSGEYSCELTFNYLSDSVSLKIEGINVNVKKAELTAPEIKSTVYTGRAQYPQIPPSLLYTFEELSFTESGVYEIPLTLSDTENYCWKNSKIETAAAVYEITKAENSFITKLTISDTYCGFEPTPFARAVFGDVTYLYSESADGSYNTLLPSVSGKYYVIATVGGTQNYSELYSEPVEFYLIEEKCVSMEIASDAEKRSYKSFELFNPSGITINVSYNSGRKEKIGLDKISFSYQNGNAFLYNDTGIIISYDKVSLVYPVSVSKSEYDISSMVFSDINLDFDGSYHSYEHIGDSIIGKDGIELNYTAYGGGRDAGTYIINVVFSSDSKEYSIPAAVTLLMNIRKKEVTTVWENTEFVYDGSTKLPVAYYYDVYGIKRYPRLTGGAVSAGEGYIADAITDDTNYLLINSQCEYQILKANYDLSKVSFSGEKYVYDGTEKCVTVYGLPDGVSAIGYTDNRYTQAGNYKLSVALSYDAENYNPPPSLTYSWQILPAEYDMSGINFGNVEAIYDGKIHYPTVEGMLPVGIDGSSPSYSFSCGATHVCEGRVAVKVVFESGSKNYDAPADRTVYVEILPKGITVEWSVLDYFYSGEIQAPTATASESIIRILGGQADAGVYTATAICENTDYCVINDTAEYTIKKANNYFTTQLRIEDIYEGRTVMPNANAHYGSIKFEFYSDAECLQKTEPLAFGTYYCVATVAESENYNALCSAPVEFKIIEVVPVSFYAQIKKDSFYAFELLTFDLIEVLIKYNDGSEKAATKNQVSFKYQNGNSLRKKDTVVYICCENRELSLPITVKYAEYDMSNVYWSEKEFVYDGEMKCPSICGLPEGVRVKEYIGMGKEAGKYKVTALFEYDSDNYNEPQASTHEFIINKCILPIPKLEAAVYCGKPQVPVSDSENYKICSQSVMVNAGTYKVNATLTDFKNYAFEGIDSDNAELDFTIQPIKLSLSVKDFEIYLFEEVGTAEYVIADGEVIDGDILEVIQENDGKRIIISSLNPNYIFEYNESKVIKINRLSPETLERILIFIFLSLLIILLALLLILNREKIRIRLIYIKENRRKNKKGTQSVLFSGAAAPALPIPKGGSNSAQDGNEIEREIMNEVEREDIILSDDAMGVDAAHADELISDSLAKNLLKRSREAVYTTGCKKEIINVDTLSLNFESGDKVDVNSLKKKGLVDEETAYIKVLARGELNKSLSVYANDFSLAAVKMIALTGGESVKVITVRSGERKQ